MKFHCLHCNFRMDESLVNRVQLTEFKKGNIPVEGIRCPFCKENTLEVVE